MHAIFKKTIALSVLLPLLSCSGMTPTSDVAATVTRSSPSPAPVTVTETGTPSVSEIPMVDARQGSSPRPASEIIRGHGFFSSPTHRTNSPVIAGDGEITLDFVNADVREVIKAVLGDLLKLNYVIDAKVQGTITISSSQPIKRDAVLPTFEQILGMNGLALVRAGDTYQVVAGADAPRRGVPISDGRKANRPGYGVDIVPLKYINTAEMRRLLEPIIPSGSILQADASRNLLMLGGTEQERATIVDNIALFDVDWLAGMSFALYVPKSAEAAQLTKELNQIIGGADNPLKGMVQLVALDRLNAVLAISSQSRYLEEIQAWLERLDRPGETVDQRLYVYRVQNGRAVDLAAVLNKALGLSSVSATATKSSTPPGEATASIQSADFSANDGAAQRQGAETGKDRGLGISGPPPSTGTMNLNITADEVNNGLVILASPREYAVVEAALRQLDTVPLQVFLEAAVAEVSLTNSLKYGVQYLLRSGNHQVKFSNSSNGAIAASYPGFSYLYSPGSNIQAILSLLDSVTNVNVISTPQVMVLNNHTASLQVGDQVPVATAQSVSTVTSNPSIVNSIQYHDTGVILKVTPRVNQGGMVMMDVMQEVSDVATTTSSTLDSPTIQERKLSTTVAVLDGETIALGGLIKDSKTNNKNGIPYLSDIPYLGTLFGTKDDEISRTELLVMITPHVVDNMQKARSVTAEMRQKLQGIQSLFSERGR